MTTLAARHPQHAWEVGARAGYAVSGLLHALIGVLALQLALGSSSADADQSGALQAVAGSPFGAVVLWFAVVAFVALGAWQAAAALRGAGQDTADRVKAGAKAVMYLALAATSYAFAQGSGSSSSGQTSDATAQLMQAPAGRFLVGAVGLGVVAVGVYHVVKGVRRKFLDDLRSLPSGRAGRAARWCGVLGYAAKGAALVVVGGLFVIAAVQQDPQEATGLDGALTALRDAPMGTVLLVLVAAGFVLFGVYCFVRARFGSL